MKESGEFRLNACQAKVWDALNDPVTLQKCIPGCENIEKVSDTELKATIKSKVGPISATFGCSVRLSDLDPPNSYRISGQGSGGAAGFAKGGASLKLVPDGAGTKLLYDVEASVGGKLAQVGARLIDGTAKKFADDFFRNLAKAVDGPQGAQPPTAVPPMSAPGTSARAAGRVRRIIGFVALAIVVLLLVTYFLSRR